MKTVRIGTLEIGAGRPCIIAPLTSPNLEGLLREVAALQNLPVDMAEWRVDMFAAAVDESGMPNTGRIQNALSALREACRIPLLATFRTLAEGGTSISGSGYAALCDTLAGSGRIDVLDVETFFSGHPARDIVAKTHAHGVPVVASNHDFHATPSCDEIVRRLTIMQNELHADILKIAVMPRSVADVLVLLDATQRMADVAERPLITMSMGPLGVISRISGQAFGCAATFGVASMASAPGQLGVGDLDTVLGILDRASR